MKGGSGRERKKQGFASSMLHFYKNAHSMYILIFEWSSGSRRGPHLPHRFQCLSGLFSAGFLGFLQLTLQFFNFAWVFQIQFLSILPSPSSLLISLPITTALKAWSRIKYYLTIETTRCYEGQWSDRQGFWSSLHFLIGGRDRVRWGPSLWRFFSPIHIKD